jgi:TatD DNase family protein
MNTQNNFIVDSHCHLDRLEGDLKQALDAAEKNDVRHILCVCIDLENFKSVLAIAEQYPHISASVGLHPTDVMTVPSTDKLIKLSLHPKVVAFGETGLDYYRDTANKDQQQESFRNHIRASKQTNKPVIVHPRAAKDDTLQIIKEEGGDQVGGVLHCFTEDLEMAEQAIDLNFYISFSGIVTFQNAKSLQEIAKKLPMDRILIETDAPYLAPVPHRGKSNQPAYVKYVAEFIAQLRGVSYQEIAEKTTENFWKLFKVSDR